MRGGEPGGALYSEEIEVRSVLARKPNHSESCLRFDKAVQSCYIKIPHQRHATHQYLAPGTTLPLRQLGESHPANGRESGTRIDSPLLL